ncbi:hypothetical protein U1Q18_040597 [Sarracenia purpurea var. burkii]
MEDTVAEVVEGCVLEAAKVSRPDEERDLNMEDIEAEDGESGAVDNEADIANQGGLPLSCPLYGNGLETGKECEIEKDSFPPLFQTYDEVVNLGKAGTVGNLEEGLLEQTQVLVVDSGCVISQVDENEPDVGRFPKDGVGMKQPGVNGLVPGLAHKVFVDMPLKNMDPGMSEDKDAAAFRLDGEATDLKDNIQLGDSGDLLGLLLEGLPSVLLFLFCDLISYLPSIGNVMGDTLL